MRKRDIRNIQWYEEIAEFLGVTSDIVKTAVADQRLEPECETRELKRAREYLRQKFMSPDARHLHTKIQREDPEQIEDVERSRSWEEYVFVCINGERRCFQRFAFYERVISWIVRPMLKVRSVPKILDYGCGSSLFTRILAQDFADNVETISADVCRYAVDFASTRNRLYNPRASSHLIENVMSVPKFKDVDIILAYAVFEHLPNSTLQIEGLVDSLSPGGMLIENYSGHSRAKPHKSDTFDAYRNRDANLDMLRENLELVLGSLPAKDNGIYARDNSTRFWMKRGGNSEVAKEMRRKAATAKLIGRIPRQLLPRRLLRWRLG
jgi:2-polyprenyl-3-methyl-5-hydroxy-6-metoxy-1,4-benzoquinol methylase